MLGSASPSFIEKLSKISQEPEFVDFTIVCDGVSYKVSRVIISAHSPYFKNACSKPFKEGLERKITLHEDAPEAVRAMIQFFQEHDYECYGSTSLSLHAGVFTVADKYEVLELKELALTHFTTSLASLPEQELIETLPSITSQVYATPLADARLRDALLDQWGRPETVLPNAAELETLVIDCPTFISDLVLWFSEALQAPKDVGSFVYDHIVATKRDTTFIVSSIAGETNLDENIVREVLVSLAAEGKIVHYADGKYLYLDL